MNHIKQNNPECKTVIQKVGCFFRSCGLIAEYQTGKYLSVKQINDTWEWAKGTGRIDEENCIKDSASIATRFLRALGDGGCFCEVGTFRGGVTYWYPSIPKDDRRADALIQKIRQGGPSVTHFRVVNKNGGLIEDPHDPPLKVLDIYYSILYEYIPEAK